MADLPLAAVVCAFIGAVMFAVSAVAQQRAAADVPEGEALLARLIRNPRWWAGVVGDMGGFGFQVAALAMGSVLVVQPILVSALVFALPLAAYYSGRRVTALMWVQAAALSVALAVFLVVGNPTEGHIDAPAHDWLGPLGLLCALIVAGVGVASVVKIPAWQALLLGTAAGLLFGISAALTEHVTQLFGHGPIAVLTNWQSYTLAATGLAGLYLQQRAYQVGPLSASLPAFTVAEPLGAAFIGIAVLDERLRSGPIGTGFVMLSVVVMCIEAIRLSRAQAAETLSSERSADPPTRAPAEDPRERDGRRDLGGQHHPDRRDDLAERGENRGQM